MFITCCIRAVGRYGAILADEMGLGKTLQSVALSWTLLQQGPYGGKAVLKRVLVVTPGSLVQNWGAEFNKWLGRERISVFTVDQVREKKLINLTCYSELFSYQSLVLLIFVDVQDHRVEHFLASPLHSVLVISYEMLLRCLEQVILTLFCLTCYTFLTLSLYFFFFQVQKVEFGLIICDEGHRLKNSAIKTSSALSSLNCQRRVILTGTTITDKITLFFSTFIC